MRGTAGLQIGHQPPARRHHERAVAIAHQRVGDFQRGTFDTAGFERRQQLHHRERMGHVEGCSINP